jgi:histidyl-tRNA synthetase
MSRRTEPMPGTTDLFAPDTDLWRFIEARAHEVFGLYGYGELRTPIFERTDVFLHSIGDDTDIVQKEMYTFEDRGGRSLTLRPEGTAGVLRAVANAGIGQGEERRVYYLGPMFRGERPAAGRRRQFHQIGVENIGRVAPAIDVECIAMMRHFFAAVGLEGGRLLINSRGVAEDRQLISSALREYFAPRIEAMCEDCQRRLKVNVARILDCKQPSCRTVIEAAPAIPELLGENSRAFFSEVCDGLAALDIEFEVDPRLIRGLDYYVHTVWELAYEGIGAQNSIAGGGRYEICPPGFKEPVPGVGFALGVERLLLALEDARALPSFDTGIDVYLVSLGSEAMHANQRLASALRACGCRVLMDLEGRGMKAQLRQANRLEARFALIRGGDELARGIVVCRDMRAATQEEMAADAATTEMAVRLDHG